MPILPGWPSIIMGGGGITVTPGFQFFTANLTHAQTFTVPNYNNLYIMVVGASGGGGASYKDEANGQENIIPTSGGDTNIYFGTPGTGPTGGGGATATLDLNGGFFGNPNPGPGGTGGTPTSSGFGTAVTAATGTNGAAGITATTSASGAAPGHDSFNRATTPFSASPSGGQSLAVEIFGGNGASWSTLGPRNGGGGGGGPGVELIQFTPGDGFNVNPGTTWTIDATTDNGVADPKSTGGVGLGGLGGQIINSASLAVLSQGVAGTNGYVYIWWN